MSELEISEDNCVLDESELDVLQTAFQEQLNDYVNSDVFCVTEYMSLEKIYCTISKKITKLNDSAKKE